jgi:hypothetical protein
MAALPRSPPPAEAFISTGVKKKIGDRPMVGDWFFNHRGTAQFREYVSEAGLSPGSRTPRHRMPPVKACRHIMKASSICAGIPLNGNPMTDASARPDNWASESKVRTRRDASCHHHVFHFRPPSKIDPRHGIVSLRRKMANACGIGLRVRLVHDLTPRWRVGTLWTFQQDRINAPMQTSESYSAVSGATRRVSTSSGHAALPDVK